MRNSHSKTRSVRTDQQNRDNDWTNYARYTNEPIFIFKVARAPSTKLDVQLNIAPRNISTLNSNM